MLQQTFFQRFGHHGVCVLPADVLSDDPLIDPTTGEELPSLREQVSLTDGIIHHCLCYARVLHTCGDGLYWADIAATPDLGNAMRVILTEEDLYFALPYDVRVQGKRPSHIRKMMTAHAREVLPVQPAVPEETPVYIPAPVLALEPLTMVEVSAEELQAVLGPVTKETHLGTTRRRIFWSVGRMYLQQAFLRVILDALMRQLYWTKLARDSARTSIIRRQCAIISSLQR